MVQASWGEKEAISKIIRPKRARGVAQIVEHLSQKRKAKFKH
jgi:hypothetical protein